MAGYHEDIVHIELESGTVFRSFMNHAIGAGDSRANRFGVRAYRNGAAENISGSVYGEFIRADGTTVAISGGTVSGNEAYVTLPAACYAVEGNFQLTIKASNAGEISTLRIVDGTVARTSTDAVEDPGDLIENIDELLADVAEATEGLDAISNQKVNKPTTSPNGTAGQLLRTNGDGTTTWVDAGNPTDAQTATAVSNWLAAHPEATTTVQDGAVTRAKLDSKLKKIADWNVPARFYFPDLSAGTYSQSCALVTIGSETMLFDAGKAEDWSLYQAWLDGLQTEGVFSNIDYIFISHYHLDHIGCLENILGRYAHAGCHAYIPPTIEGHAAEQEYLVTVYANITSILSTAGVTTHVVTSDTTVSTATDFAEVELFNTTSADYLYYDGLYSGSDAIYNNYSLCALIRTGDLYSMFPGDIQSDAQKRIMATRGTLPRLFVYPVHHHGIQSDDYVPYLNAIDPQYNVVSTSQNRILISATSSSGMNYFNGQKGTTAYDEYRYACDGESGQVIRGREIQKIGFYYFNVDVYVDNEYTGTVRDGTEDHPFTQISEAIAFINRGSNLRFRIRVKGTATRYDFMWLRDYLAPVEFIGYKGTANVFPSVHGGYIGEGVNVSISNFIFDGDGRDQYDFHPLLFVWASNVYMNNCTFDGANVPADYAAKKIGLYIQETREVYMTGCTFSNLVNGARAYRYGGLTSAGTTFDTISSSGYNLINMEVRLRGLDTVSAIGTGKWMLSAATGGATPLITDSGCITTAMAALISKQATSQPFYVNDSHPACVLAKSKIYDLFSGDEVTIS